LGTVGTKSQIIWIDNIMKDVHQLYRERKLPVDTNIYIAWRKADNRDPFKIPMQGYYADTLSKEERAEWQNLR
jgi:hypothetical protein